MLRRLRALSAGQPGQVLNLRVTPCAVEFDFFIPGERPGDVYFAAWKSIGKKLTLRDLDGRPALCDPARAMKAAKHLWDEHRFWEVHEVLEEPWKKAHGRERDMLQGFILGAAALVHLQKNEAFVVPSMIQSALTKLQGQPVSYYGWNLEKFRRELKRMGIIDAHL